MRWFLACLLIPLVGEVWAQGRTSLPITHQYSNTNAQSLIGLPMGDYKTIVDMEGNLHWSQWTLKRRGLDVPFGFSGQMDGEADLELFLEPTAGPPAHFKVSGQELYKGRFPFVVTNLESGELKAEEVAFAANVPGSGMDVVRIRVRNQGGEALPFEAHFSGKYRNLPAAAAGSALATREGYLVALAQAETGTFSSAIHGLELDYHARVPARSTITLWVKRPYELLSKDSQALIALQGDRLLDAAEKFWLDLWSHGTLLDLPEKELVDFYYSSLAYVLILTERDAAGDLWTLDGPAGYAQYWGRGEYFQARAMEVAGYLDIARETVEHSFRQQKDDGEWDWPAISGWPSWDNIGGNAGAVWDYYLYTRDKAWLRRAYPHLLAAAQWIAFHRQETEVPNDAPPGAKPIKRQIPWSCKEEPEPPLAPGEKPYWWGLLPWGYGDSGLSEGHAYAHNVMALYAVKCAWQAASTLGRQADADRLSAEYADYKQAILASMRRAISLEKDSAPYLPAMPTYPQAAVSQSLLAVYPTELLSPQDPWVTGLLTRIEQSELQGLPTNMAWLGQSGVWPGESMNMAEIYLRRGNIQKAVNMLIASLNHSYTTKVWKEEIRVDKNLPVTCIESASSHKVVPDGAGTGDMPEAWANANLVDLVRDMLVREDGDTLYLFSGIPADWIKLGDTLDVQGAQTTFGGRLASIHLTYPEEGKMVLLVTAPPAGFGHVLARFPLGDGQAIISASVNGRPVRNFSGPQIPLDNTGAPLSVVITFK